MFQNKGTCWIVERTFISISFVSFVMFLLPWIAGLNLVISTQHHYSAQIDFDMHEFKLLHYSAQINFDMHEFELLLFSNALRYYHVFGIKWKNRKMPLIMKHIVWLNPAWQWRYRTDETGFLFIGTHCILDRGNEVRLVALDIKGAFDKVWYNGLCSKLKGKGVRGKLLAWIENYLSDSSMKVVFSSQSSATTSINVKLDNQERLRQLVQA